MRTATVKIEGISRLSWGKPIETERKKDESYKEFETRIWQDKFHYNSDGNVVIPAMAFQGCLSSAAKYKNRKIPGKRNATYTKYFESGIMVVEDLILPQKKEDLGSEWLFLPAGGKPGGGTRVWKCFPIIEEWRGDMDFYLIEDEIPKNVFEEFLIAAGQIKGIGFWRPEKRGLNGRFKVMKIIWGSA